MKKLKLLTIITSLSLISFFISQVFASEPELFFSSVRQKAMGGAYVAISNDTHALYQNPAGLSSIKNLKISFLPIKLEIENSFLQHFSEFSTVKKDFKDIGSLLMEITPSRINAKVGVMPGPLSFAVNGFGIGYFSDSQVQLDLIRPTNPRIDIAFRNDNAGIIGLSRDITIFNTNFAIGATAKYIYRIKLYDKKTGNNYLSYGLADLLKKIDTGNLDDDIGIYASRGFGFDIGALSKLNTGLGNGQWGIVFKNIGTKLSGEKEIGSVSKTYNDEIPLSVTIGLGIETDIKTIPILTFFDDMSFALDYDFISQQNSIFQKIHMGLEKRILGILKLRGGLNQGYVVGGFGLDLWFLHANYSYFIESEGSEVGIDEKFYHVVDFGIYF